MIEKGRWLTYEYTVCVHLHFKGVTKLIRKVLDTRLYDIANTITGHPVLQDTNYRCPITGHQLQDTNLNSVKFEFQKKNDVC